MKRAMAELDTLDAERRASYVSDVEGTQVGSGQGERRVSGAFIVALSSKDASIWECQKSWHSSMGSPSPICLISSPSTHMDAS